MFSTVLSYIQIFVIVIGTFRLLAASIWELHSRDRNLNMQSALLVIFHIILIFTSFPRLIVGVLLLYIAVSLSKRAINHANGEMKLVRLIPLTPTALNNVLLKHFFGYILPAHIALACFPVLIVSKII